MKYRYGLEVLDEHGVYQPVFGACNVESMARLVVKNALISRPEIAGARVVDKKTGEVIYGLETG